MMIWLYFHQYLCNKYLDDILSCVEASRSSSNDTHLWAAGREGRVATPIYAFGMNRQLQCNYV